MFEKEALTYAVVSLPDGYTKIDYQKKTDWQKGAEYGYNKAKGEIKELLKTLIENCPDTYSGTDAALSQKRMFRFQDARNKAELFLKEVEK